MTGARWLGQIVTVALLLLVAFEILGCGRCAGETCSLLQESSHHTSHSESTDECLCCCAQVVVTATPSLVPVARLLMAPPALAPRELPASPLPIDHPPPVLVG